MNGWHCFRKQQCQEVMRKVRVGRERGVRGRCDSIMIAADADAGAGAGAGRKEGRVEITFTLS